MPTIGPFAAQGDPNSILTSDNARFSFDFSILAETDGFFALDACADGSTWSKAQSNEWDAHFHLSPSPLVSESSTLSTLSSSAPSLSASPLPSPFCAPSDLPEVNLVEGFDFFGRCPKGIEPDQELEAAEQFEYRSTGTSIDAAFNDHKQNLNFDQVGRDTVQRLVETLDDSAFKISAPSEQELDLQYEYSMIDVSIRSTDDCQPSTEPKSSSARPHLSTPRRAASVTKMRLEALFGDEEDNEDAQADVRVSHGVRTKKNGAYENGTPRSRATKKRKVQSQMESVTGTHDNQSSHCNDDDSDWQESTAETLASASSRPTKRTTYTDLASSGHPLTLPSLSSTFMLPPADCPSCAHGFARAGDLVRHLRAYHQARDAALACPGCATEFSRTDSLARHRAGGACKGRKRKRRMRRWEVQAARGQH